MIKTYLTIFFTLICVLVFGQEQNKGLLIYTNVGQNIDISHPRLNLGVEKYLKNNQSVSIGLGIYYYNWFYREATNGVNLNLEYKIFRKNNFYYAIGLNWGKLKYNATHEYYLDGDTVSTYSPHLESYKIDKLISDLYIKYGFRNDIGKHFYFDSFVGLGLRYKETIHVDRVHTWTQYREVRILDIRDKEGGFISPILKLGIIIGLKI